MDLFRLTELEEAIQRSEQRWTALLKATPDSAFSLAQDGIIQFVYSDKTDWIPAAKLGSNLYDSLLPDDHRILSKCLERVFEIGDPRGCELRSAISGGDIRNWSFHLGLIGEVRTAVGALVVVREITGPTKRWSNKAWNRGWSLWAGSPGPSSMTPTTF